MRTPSFSQAYQSFDGQQLPDPDQCLRRIMGPGSPGDLGRQTRCFSLERPKGSRSSRLLIGDTSDSLEAAPAATLASLLLPTTSMNGYHHGC